MLGLLAQFNIKVFRCGKFARFFKQPPGLVEFGGGLQEKIDQLSFR